MRLFTAIELPENVRGYLRRRQETWIQWSGWSEAGCPVSWTAPQNLHITLKFLGEVGEADLPALTNALAGVPVPAEPLSLLVEDLLALPKRGPIRVIAAGVGGDVERLGALYRNVESVAAGFGCPVERRPYLPHITIGRSRNGLRGHLRRHWSRDARPPSGPEFQASAFALMLSDLTKGGPVYTRLHSIPFAAVI